VAGLSPCYGPVFTNIKFSAQAIEEKDLVEAGWGKKRRIRPVFLPKQVESGPFQLGGALLNFGV
jgi:hypothetical protein